MVAVAALLNFRGAFSMGKPRGGARALLAEAYEKDYQSLNLFEDVEADLCDDALIQHLDPGESIVDVEVIDAATRPAGEPEVLATLPGEITVDLPEEFEPEQTIFVRGGPHSRSMKVQIPKWARPGGQRRLSLYLGPAAELRIQVPDGKKAGDQLEILREDGKELVIDIPDDMRPGDVFEYTPPALMVAAPEGSSPGDFVLFRHHKSLDGGRTTTEYCRAQVPEELIFGRYFAARLPTSRRPNRSDVNNPWLPFPWAWTRERRSRESEQSSSTKNSL